MVWRRKESRENPHPDTATLSTAAKVGMATGHHLAEFLGAALGPNLLFHIPLPAAGILTAFVTFLILALQSRGFRPLEAVITALLGVVAFCYLIETILDKPDSGKVLHHAQWGSRGSIPRAPKS